VGQGVEICEVGPRDGFQSVAPFIPTPTKIAILNRLYAAGLRRIEATSFVSLSAVPQLADAAEIVAAALALPGLDAQVLVPTVRHAERAICAGVRHVAFVLSVSERHNWGNVRRSPAESVGEYRRIVEALPAGADIRLNVATAFDCPFDGAIKPEVTLALLDELVTIMPAAEIALCDTTGRVFPNQVSELFTDAIARYPQVKRWAFHAHDTFGLGAANALAAWNSGVRVFDASVAGLGGCPFAPGATGNIATEDLTRMFEGMAIATGIDLERLVAVALQVAGLPGAQTGGRVREAMMSRACLPDSARSA
jgi:hydroxymethylglutaryl-CoA lyase